MLMCSIEMIEYSVTRSSLGFFFFFLVVSVEKRKTVEGGYRKGQKISMKSLRDLLT